MAEHENELTPGPLTAPTKVMAEMLALSEVHIGRLSKDGTLPPPISRGVWDVVVTARAYVQWLAAKGVKAEEERAEEFALTVARRQRTQHLTELAAMELAEKRGEIGNLAVMATEVGHMLTGLKGRLSSIGAIVAPTLALATTPAERQRIVEAAIFEALDEISGSPFSFLGPWSGGRGEGPGGASGGDGGDTPVALPPDAERMG